MFGFKKELKEYNYSQEELAKFNYAKITTEKGTIYIKLFNQETPIAVSNFATLANDGFYNGLTRTKDTAWFIEEATKIHGDKYDYSKVVFTRFHNKVEIVCPTHGSFFQTAVHITAGQGCNECSVRDYEGGYGLKRFENHPELKDLDGMMYLIECSSDTEHFFKIGITSKTVEHRFNGRIPYNYTVVATMIGSMFELFTLEQYFKKSLKAFKYRPQVKFCGHTECLTLDSPILEKFKT